MRVGRALRVALRDFYENSWRLLAVNAGVATVAVAGLLAGSYFQPALALLVLVGPAFAALVHCAVELQQTGRVRVADAVEGLRLHWRRGLLLGLLVVAAGGLAVLAVRFYAQGGPGAWPLAVAAAYVFAFFGVWQIHLWPLAVLERERPLRRVSADALRGLARRPVASIALAFWLLVVNLVGAVGILPLLTLTIAYSCLAAAHFALPAPTEEAAT